MSEPEDDVDARLEALEREVAHERTEAELRALDALQAEERELEALSARLAALHRAHRHAVAEALGGYGEREGVRDTSVRLPLDLFARLDQLAGERGQPVEDLCAEVLDGYLRSRRRPPAPGAPSPAGAPDVGD